MGLVGVVGELARHGDHLVARDAGDLLLPGRGVGHVLVEALRRVLAFQAARHAVLSGLQVEHGGDGGIALFALLAELDSLYGHRAQQHVAVIAAGKVLVRDAAVVGESDLRVLLRRVLTVQQRQLELHVGVVACFLGLQVPLAGVRTAVRAPAEADGALRDHDLAVLIEGQGLPLGIVRLAQLAVEVAGAQVAVRHQGDGAGRQHLLLHHDQHGQVGIAAGVVVEVLAAPVEVELLEDHVAHGHGHGRVGALLRVQPEVGELGDFGIVRCHSHRLGAFVADLGEEMGVRCARLRDVGTPGDDVAAVVPVGGFRHVGLLAPHLRGRRGQVAVPVIERHAYAADQREVARTRGVADHGHGRDRGEADDAVRSVLADRVDVRRCDHLVDLVPAGAHEAAQAALFLVALAAGIVLGDPGPCFDRQVGEPGLAPQLQQAAAHQGVLHAVGGVQVPAVAGAAGAATRFVIGHVPASARIVGLLGFPSDDAALDVDLPRAGARAVHAVGAAHDLVMLPALAIGVFPGPVFTGDLAVAVRKFLAGLREVAEAVEEMAHKSWSPGMDNTMVRRVLRPSA